MNSKYRAGAVGALWTLAALLPLAAGAQPVDLSRSSVTATFTQMGVPVEAKFTRFAAQVTYDPQAPEKTTAAMQVDVASFDLGDPEYNAEVRKPEWFDAGKYGKATFATQSVRALAADRLEAHGTLTIKGRAQQVVVPVVVKQVGATRSFTGELPIRRLAFRIGEGQWRETDMVADAVRIRFTVVTAAQ